VNIIVVQVISLAINKIKAVIPFIMTAMNPCPVKAYPIKLGGK